MEKESFAFLKELIDAPSPSGFEQPAQGVVRRYMKEYADAIRTDVHGNVICALNPNGKPRVMLAGHCDQIGFIIRHIDDSGYIRFQAIGGIDPGVIIGQRVKIHNKRGVVTGIIGKKPIHLLSPDEQKKTIARNELHKLWIDIGAKNSKDALKHVAVGDPITFDIPLAALMNNLVTGSGFDDKVGTFVVCETLRLLKQRADKKQLKAAVFAVSTVQEELGLRGAVTSAFSIEPQVGIAVDVGFSSDYPTVEKDMLGDLKVGGGPMILLGANMNPKLGDLLIETAKKKKIRYQIEATPNATGTDANAIQISRSGVAAGLISIPNRYMHTTVEVVSQDDLSAAATLLAETIARITPDMSFIPE